MDSTLEASRWFVDLYPCSTEENISNPDRNFTSPRGLAGLIPWALSCCTGSCGAGTGRTKFCSPFQTAIVENQIRRLDYLFILAIFDYTICISCDPNSYFIFER
jgi:hypothetical protein